MNILFLSTRLNYPPIGGHSQRTFNIIKYLSTKHNIFYVSFYKNGIDEKQKTEYLSALEKYCRECYAFDIGLEKYKLIFILRLIKSLFLPKPFIAYKYYSKEYGDCIKNILSRIKIDIVHFDMLPLSEYKELIPAVKTLLTEHNVEYLRYFRWVPYAKNFIKRFYIIQQYKKLKKYEIEMVKKFKLCVVVSEIDKQELSKNIKNVNFRVVPNGTDINYFKNSQVLPDANTLVWAGGMKMWPNKDAILYFMNDIFPKMLKINPKIIFRVIGNNPPLILNSFRRRENLEMYGYVDDIRPIVEKSMVYVAPIRIGSGTKLKILDAMAMGKAIVTTSIGAEGIDVKNNEHLFICDSPDQFIEKTILLLKSSELNKKMGEEARKFVEKEYSWEKIFLRLEDAYSSCFVNS